jgi:hypothetical protein
MKRISLLLLLTISFLPFINAGTTTQRTWIIGNFGIDYATANHSTTQLSAPEVYTTVLVTPNDPSTWTGTKQTGALSANPTGLEVCPNYRISSASKADPNTTTGYGTFGGKMQLQGFATAVVSPAIPTTSYLSFNVSGSATIKIYCNPVDATTKTLNFANTAGTVVNTVTSSAVSSSNNSYAEVLTVSYTGGATKLTIYPTFSNTAYLYIYAIDVVESTTTDIQEHSNDINIKQAGNILENSDGENIEIYTITGNKVLSSNQTSIDLSNLSGGVYIAKTAKGSIKFIR